MMQRWFHVSVIYDFSLTSHNKWIQHSCETDLLWGEVIYDRYMRYLLVMKRPLMIGVVNGMCVLLWHLDNVVKIIWNDCTRRIFENYYGANCEFLGWSTILSSRLNNTFSAPYFDPRSILTYKKEERKS